MAIIDKPSDYFETKLYTGDNTNNREISLGLTPDLTWIKARNVAYGHSLFDRIRGLGFSLSSNNTNADRNVGSEFGWSNSGCTTDSFTVDRGSNESLNESGRPMVAWNWKAGGTASSNTDGSITSSVSANQDAGFSIVSYSGNSTVGATVGHSLNKAPEIVFTKATNVTASWNVNAPNVLGNGYNLALQTTAALSFYNAAWTTNSTNLVLADGGGHNQTGRNYIAYVFHSVQGYSKIGSYTGNGNSDGTFVYLGFKPAFVMVKRTDASAHWRMFDNKREGYNVDNDALKANASDAETTTDFIDLLSNGFKLRSSDSAVNGGTVIYMAFASEPFTTSTGIPCTAR